MRIKKEWYDEDQQEKEKEIADLESDMIRDSKDPLQDGLYGSVSIEK